ncbi:MAG: bifunctional precorrin-2 dehydrogenase/sirohydrochlorin ferrochelatase [Desulfobacteraceae bacterium]
MAMNYYPVCLDIKEKNCLVVGGGKVGTRKALSLAECGARVTIVSPEITGSLENRENITLVRRVYDKTDLTGMMLVFGATNHQELNRQIWRDATEKNVLCNIADFPEACNFILPAVVRRGDLVITVSTSGSSPAFAKRVKKELENEFGEEYADFLFLMGKIRKKLLAEQHDPESHKTIFETFIEKGLLQMIRQKEMADMDALIASVLGTGYSYNYFIQGESE